MWAVPGMKGFEHRIGGLEKADLTGHVNYDADNHHHMVELRQKKVDIIQDFIPKATPFGDDSGELLVIGWGGTYGSIRSAVIKARGSNLSVSHLHLRHINPFPKNLKEVLDKFDKVLIPELNLGQLSYMIRSQFLVDCIGLNKVAGRSFIYSEILEKINEIIN